MTGYTHDFFDGRHARTQHAARTVLGIVRERVPEIRSAVDVGCGVGTWLSVLRDGGTADVVGLDGDWVPDEALAIPKECVRRGDLAAPVDLGRRFDLAISLEVAEHLPPERGAGFVDLLTGLSDLVVFSAAIPRQGGRNHVNEQWQGHWVRLFAERGHSAHDVVRPRIWDDRTIAVWYRQNLLVYTRRGSAAEAAFAGAPPSGLPRDVVHPDLYLAKPVLPESVRGAFRHFTRTVGRKLRRRS